MFFPTSRYSAGHTITLNSRITASDYVDILDNRVHPMIQMLFPDSGAIFQGYSSLYTQPEGLSEEHEDSLRQLPWPAQSPPLNITESLWSVSESRVRSRFRPPSSLKQLEVVIHGEWYNRHNVQRSLSLSFGLRPLFLLTGDILPWSVCDVLTLGPAALDTPNKVADLIRISPAKRAPTVCPL